MPPYQIRNMNEQDAALICQWKYPKPYDVYNWPDWNFVNEHEIEFGDRELRDKQYRAVIDASEHLIGFVQLFPLDTTIRLAMFLAPDCCDRGLGQQLIQLAIAEARRLYSTYDIDLEVETWNKRAIACYSHAGFAISDSYELPSSNALTSKQVYCMVYSS